MIAAGHVAEKMKSLDRSIVDTTKEAGKTARYYVRTDAADGVKFLDDAGQRALVEKMTVGQIEYRLRSVYSLNAYAQRRHMSY